MEHHGTSWNDEKSKGRERYLAGLEQQGTYIIEKKGRHSKEKK